MELPIRKSSILRIMTYDDRQPDMTSSEISVVGLSNPQICSWSDDKLS